MIHVYPEAALDLASIIDGAPAGATLSLSPGSYTCSSILIRRDLRICGEGRVFLDGRSQPGGILTVANGVRLRLSHLTLMNGLSVRGAAVRFLGRADFHAICCSFVDNSAVEGGALAASDGRVVLDTCGFVGNSARNRGGALLVEDTAELQVEWTSFKDNRAERGGVLWVGQRARARLQSCRILTGSWTPPVDVCGAVEGVPEVSLINTTITGDGSPVALSSVLTYRLRVGGCRLGRIVGQYEDYGDNVFTNPTG